MLMRTDSMGHSINNSNALNQKMSLEDLKSVHSIYCSPFINVLFWKFKNNNRN